MKKKILYQNFLIRVFSFIPIIFLLAFIEYQILKEVISDRSYILISIILMLILSNFYLKYSRNLFIREGSYIIKENEIHIQKNSKLVVCCIDEIKDVEIMKIQLYGVCVAKLNIYCKYNNNRIITLYSQDMMHENIEKEELWEFYAELKRILSDLSLEK